MFGNSEVSEYLACMFSLLTGATDCNRVNSHKACFQKVSRCYYFELRWGKIGNSNMSEDLAPFSIHKNFNLILNQVSLTEVLNFRIVRIFCLHVLSTKWGALVVIGWIPTKHSFGKFHIDINSKFVEKSLEIQLCHEILPLFPLQKFQSTFRSTFVEECLEIQKCQISRLHVLSTIWGLLIVIGWIPMKHAFEKFQCDIISNLVEESLEIQICQKMLPLFPFTKFPIYFWVNFRWGMFEIQKCQFFSPACSI